ncbi:ArnT family glycosyltransferase [Halorussus marinus]|uniref:ArnT family glycosyltransferase n=1 Tax=Halorussus marinus TaxID=2505976 RepID=UPI001092664C|nr:glycosyltransferase family 39 protein [Halorussus marinus]
MGYQLRNICTDSTEKFWYLVWILPASAVLPLLFAPLLIQYRATREVAGYYQALAFAHDGLQSFSYLTPRESFSSLHLSSLLTAPFAHLGFGIRLVSITAAIAATILIGQLAWHRFGRTAGLLAPLFLWAHPLFLRFSYGVFPEALSIVLTTGAVAAMWRFVETDHDWLFGLSVALLVLAMANHFWEAVIGLPLFVILITRRYYLHALLLSLVTAGTAGTIWMIRRVLGPVESGKLLERGTIVTDPGLLVSSDYWLAHLQSIHPVDLMFTLTLPTALLALAGSLRWWLVSREERALVLAAWLTSGLVIPIGIPPGYLTHDYYLWGVLAPLALAGGVFVQYTTGRLRDRGHPRLAGHTVQAVIVLLVCSAFGFGLIVDGGLLSGTGVPVAGEFDGQLSDRDGIAVSELAVAGEEVDRADVSAANEIVFVGDWKRGYSGPVGVVLAQTDVLVKGWEDPRYEHRGRHGAFSPRFADTPAAVEDCGVQVVLHNDDSVVVQSC